LIGTKSILIDSEQGLVTMDIGTFTITQVTENDLSFQDRAWRGHMDHSSCTSQVMSKWSLLPTSGALIGANAVPIASCKI
jgi:hypothetical protein